jgi:isocitrate dehydrogenase
MIPASFDKEGTLPMDTRLRPRVKAKKELVGVDVFIDWDQEGRDPNVIGEKLRQVEVDGLQMHLITNRGVKVFPEGMRETFCTDHWRCRFKTDDGSLVTHAQILELLKKIQDLGFDFIKTEHLYTFDGVRGYSLAQGE